MEMRHKASEHYPTEKRRLTRADVSTILSKRGVPISEDIQGLYLPCYDGTRWRLHETSGIGQRRGWLFMRILDGLARPSEPRSHGPAATTKKALNALLDTLPGGPCRTCWPHRPEWDTACRRLGDRASSCNCGGGHGHAVRPVGQLWRLRERIGDSFLDNPSLTDCPRCKGRGFVHVDLTPLIEVRS